MGGSRPWHAARRPWKSRGRASRFVGFSQYDHVLKLPDESDVPPNGALLYAAAGSDGITWPRPPRV